MAKRKTSVRLKVSRGKPALLEANLTKERAISAVADLMRNSTKFTIDIQNRIERQKTKCGYHAAGITGKIITITMPI